MGITRTVSEINGDFSRKLQIFPTSCIITAPAKGVPIGIFFVVGWAQKLKRYSPYAHTDIGRFARVGGFSRTYSLHVKSCSGLGCASEWWDKRIAVVDCLALR